MFHVVVFVVILAGFFFFSISIVTGKCCTHCKDIVCLKCYPRRLSVFIVPFIVVGMQIARHSINLI